MFFSFPSWAESFMSCLASKMIQKRHSEATKQTKQTTTKNGRWVLFFRFRRGLRVSCHVNSAARKRTKITMTENSLCVFCFHFRRGLRVCHVWLQRCSNDDTPNPENKKTNNDCKVPFMFFSFPRWNWGFYVMSSSFKDAPKTICRTQETNKANTNSKLPCVCVCVLFIRFRRGLRVSCPSRFKRAPKNNIPRTENKHRRLKTNFCVFPVSIVNWGSEFHVVFGAKDSQIPPLYVLSPPGNNLKRRGPRVKRLGPKICKNML